MYVLHMYAYMYEKIHDASTVLQTILNYLMVTVCNGMERSISGQIDNHLLFILTWLELLVYCVP